MKRDVTLGSLEVICGSMFSGKSEELIRRLKRSEIAQKNVIVFKHALDTRRTNEYVTSHNGSKIKAYSVDGVSEIHRLTQDFTDVIGIDEVQFFGNEVVELICKFIDQGKKVIVAGLDLDFKGTPFGPVPALMAIADKITKLKAICVPCGKDAHFSQRLIDGHPAKTSDPLIMVGADEKYQARCRNCFETK